MSNAVTQHILCSFPSK